MKIRKIQWVNLVIALLFTPLLFAQNNKPAPGNFDRFVQEVYTGQGAKTMAEDTRRYAFMKEFYENRITFLSPMPKNWKVPTSLNCPKFHFLTIITRVL